MNVKIYNLFFILISLFACEKRSDEVVYRGNKRSECKEVSGSNSQGSSDPQQMELTAQNDSVSPDVTYDDIKEIFDSRTSPRNYRCTVCHAQYQQMAGIANDSEFTKILASIQRDADPMPRSGDRVLAADIAKLKRWKELGYPVRKSANPDPSPSASPYPDKNTTIETETPNSVTSPGC